MTVDCNAVYISISVLTKRKFAVVGIMPQSRLLRAIPLGATAQSQHAQPAQQAEGFWQIKNPCAVSGVPGLQRAPSPAAIARSTTTPRRPDLSNAHDFWPVRRPHQEAGAVTTQWFHGRRRRLIPAR